jgi:hypothetical protein
MLLPNGKQQFCDENGIPYTGGQVFFYIPGVGPPSVLKDTYEDHQHTVINPNPIVLDAAGRAVIFGLGRYRQILFDQLGNQIWDQETEAPVSADDLANVVFGFALPIEWQGSPTDGEVYPIVNIPFEITLPVALVGSIFTVDPGSLPSATSVFTLKRNGSVIGTVSFDTGGTPTVTFLTAIDWSPGDQLTIVAPSPADATMAQVAWTLVFTNT